LAIRTKNYDKALEEIGQIFILDPTYIPAFVLKAFIYMKDERYEEFQTYMGYLNKIMPATIYVLFMKAFGIFLSTEKLTSTQSYPSWTRIKIETNDSNKRSRNEIENNN
jgi:hypothetical protein